MRKILAIVIAAGVLFAVGAFAATITNVDGEDITSGADSVENCATDVDVDFDIGSYDTTNDDWDVDEADVSVSGTCPDGATVRLAIENGSGTLVFEKDGSALAAGASNVTLTGGDTQAGSGAGSAIQVQDVENVAVLIDGFELTAVDVGFNSD